MKRKIYDRLLKWKNEDAGEYSLLIEGARRVGKSYIAKKFAMENYKSYILIDFNEATDEVKNIFNHFLSDLDSFFMYISNYYGVTLYERNTVFIFDEVQLFPRARSAIKYLVADGRYDYIETGSLVSIKENFKDILLPSEEMHISMYPMDFEEFLWAMGDNQIWDFIKKCFEEKKPLGQLLHRKVMNYFRQYLIVGGMPQAVSKYVKTKDFKEVDKVKRNILNLYRDDIKKYAGKYSIKVESIFDEIPSQLSKHEKKFKLSSLSKNAKLRDYEESFLWLKDAMVVNNCYNTTEPNIGLSLNRENTLIKCYMSDTGLLISHSFDEKGIVSEEIYKKILFDKLDYNGGMIIENVVSNMLVSSGHKLYFYSNYSKENTKDRMEIDFLIQSKSITSKHNICPIEVKSSSNYTLISLNKFINKYKEKIDVAYIIHTKDLRVDGDKIYLPIYMTDLL